MAECACHFLMGPGGAGGALCPGPVPDAQPYGGLGRGNVDRGVRKENG
jgi:hypothetical protein